MTITIHRGNQIGGCITIIEHDGCKIIIDLGSNLPGSKQEEYTNEDIAELTKGANAIFYTHYHGDHTGLHYLVNPKIPQFIGEGAREVMICKYRKLSQVLDVEQQLASTEKMHTFVAGKSVDYNGSDKIRIIPYFVSHSAFDAYMFLIECDGLRILHTGDFRRHSYLGKGLFPILSKIGSVDILITEGTMLGRRQETVLHENDIKKNVINVLKKHRYVYALCSSTDIDRLASFHKACDTTKRIFLVDNYQKQILDIFSKYAGVHSPLFNFSKTFEYCRSTYKAENVVRHLKYHGFLMPVRSSQIDIIKEMMEVYDEEEPWLIYSMWNGYAEEGKEYSNNDIIELRKLFGSHILDGTHDGFHTSGHADVATLEEVCQTVNPAIGVIPIHKDKSSSYNMDSIKKYKIFTASERVSNKLNIILE